MSKFTILVVEDEEQIRENISMFLSFSDFQVLNAENGLEGIELARKFIPDLIISDIMMPEMDGYEFLKQIQNFPETYDIPFLFLTAKYSPDDLREGMNLGADDFISKPFDFNELLTSINKRLEKKQKKFSKLQSKIENLQSNIKQALPHEIRTPLNIIIGSADYIKSQIKIIPKEEVLEMTENILLGAKRLQNLLEKYIFFSQLEMLADSEIEIAKLKRNITAFPDTYVYDIAYSICSKSNRFDDIQLNLINEKVAILDQHFIKICNEIIDNNVKFSDIGTKIIIDTYIYDNYYCIEFTDHGRGLSAEQINNLDTFIQFDRRKYEQQGAGIGLAIVKKLVEIYDGVLQIESKINSFTKIIIKLPLAN